MEITEQDQLNNPTMMNSIGNQLRNMPIPSPPSLSSSCEDDSDDISDEDEDSMSVSIKFTTAVFFLYNHRTCDSIRH